MSETGQYIFDIVIGCVALYSAIMGTYHLLWLRRRRREDEENRKWDATFASPEGQAALEKLAAETRD